MDSTTTSPQAGPRRRGLTLASAFLLAAPVGIALLAAPAGADSATSVAALPTGLYGAVAVWDGTNAYIFSGANGVWPTSLSNQIVRFNPATGAVATMGATLPISTFWASAVWDGTNVYIFGGVTSNSVFLNQIVRYNPATDTVTTMSATLPSARYGTSAVWDGSNAYIFGGYDNSFLTQVVRYNPATNTVTTMGATLPSPASEQLRGSAVWDGANAYLFGGVFSDRILRYSPATDTVTTMPAVLPSERMSTSAVWDGSNAYIFGGTHGDSGPYLSQVVRYNPTTNAVTTMAATLPSARYGTSAVWTGSNAYVFGGFDGNYVNQVVRYNLAPGAPQAPDAIAGPTTGSITLKWQSPASNSYSSPITGYKVYRGTTSSNLAPVTSGGCANVGVALKCTDSGLADGVTYHYRVSAVNSAGEGAQSNEVSDTTCTLLPVCLATWILGGGAT